MHNYLYKYDSRASIQYVMSRLTKTELRSLLDDYDTKLEKNIRLSLQYYRDITLQLNAALCIQKYILQKYAKYTYVNQECPITLSAIAIPLKLILRPTQNKSPFHFFVSQYELDEFARYLMTSMSFIDINTQLPLTKLHIRYIDANILNYNFFLPSLFNLYTTRLNTKWVNTQSELQSFLTALERSMSEHITLLYDYMFENSLGHRQTLQRNQIIQPDAPIKYACSIVTKTLFQIKKIDSQHMQIVQSNILEHLRHAESHSTLTHLNTNYQDLHETSHPEIFTYIFDSINNVS